MYKLVIDTNVLVSSRLSRTGNPAKIMEMVADEKASLVYSSKIINEYRRVLAYDKFKFDIDKQRATIDDIIDIGEFVTPATSSAFFDKDESDRVFYDTAKSSGAILITGNIKHYPDEPFIMTPTDFLAFYNSGKYKEIDQ